jgi:hypothetical protein
LPVVGCRFGGVGVGVVGGFGGGVGVAVVGGEVGAGDLDGPEQEAGAFEVDVVAGEAGGDQADGVLDGGAVVEVIEQEGVVLDDGGDVVGTVLVAHELVVHGGVAATGAVLFGFVHALVGLGRFAIEVFEGCCHGGTPPGSELAKSSKQTGYK